MGPKNNARSEIQLKWSYKSKEHIAHLVEDLTAIIERNNPGLYDELADVFQLGEFLYALGHNARGFDEFCQLHPLVTLNGLEDLRSYNLSYMEGNGLEATISASDLLIQIAKTMENFKQESKGKENWFYESLGTNIQRINTLVAHSVVNKVRIVLEPENPLKDKENHYELVSYSFLREV